MGLELRIEVREAVRGALLHEARRSRRVRLKLRKLRLSLLLQGLQLRIDIREAVRGILLDEARRIGRGRIVAQCIEFLLSLLLLSLQLSIQVLKFLLRAL